MIMLVAMSMLCYDVLCYVMLRCANVDTNGDGMSCYVMLCYDVLC